uniref:V-type proton ATPase subunit n=1 Tax=Lotharella globosa TaxID=91324 RepID=A0A6V3RLA8_9EUKA|mmetsp:Transcript_6554/g.12964  ORF Transcript_6554/g.12964 Transcript_6554/m.12964 type:complete len:425 (+) Transcript_6554:47-1321(+)|eukprot:CAMPEP_0167791014 /NCGR_PEP_ID=MMETSP0111_2-20121227/11664_1 /TAXON_ID=91324 /ORGANISM="Lotharella globosa, Strain CCCM811" /LENGTH=424 /DNA_ID=CAMNT_0007683563 /DNA_START=46 /DNA_END=1320 /DNA_ORIENTATION=+
MSGKDRKDEGLSEEARRKAEYFEHMSYYRFNGPAGGLTTWNAENGFLEARVRGFRSGFLTGAEYKQLMQCNSLDEVKLALTDTDYGQWITTVAKGTEEKADLYAKRLMKACQDKFLAEFEYLRMHATGHMQTFLDMITYGPMIENFCKLIIALQKTDNAEEVLEELKNADPLGAYPHLNSIVAFDKADDLLTDLFDSLLVDTPVSKYFWQYFLPEMTDEDEKKEDGSHALRKFTAEVQLDIMINTLQKYLLEDMYNYSRELGGETWDIMKDLLEFEADRRTINVTVNSFGTPLNEPDRHDYERKMLYPNFGELHPDGQTILSGYGPKPGVSDFATLANEFKQKTLRFSGILQDEENYVYAMRQEEAKMFAHGFDSQSHYGCFYAFYKLKQIELGNLQLIFDTISQPADVEQKRNLFKSVTPIFE